MAALEQNRALPLGERTGLQTLSRQIPADGSNADPVSAFDPADVAGDNEIFLLRTVDAGQRVPKGACMVRAFLRGGLLDSSYRLSGRAKDCVRAIKGLFDR